MLKKLRDGLRLSQQGLAKRLGVSQAYVAMLETGQRKLTATLARKLVSLGASPTVLPPGRFDLTGLDNQLLAKQLGRLGYPGFAYLGKYVRWRNPTEVLLAALVQNELEARTVEALPWLLQRYPQMDFDWLVGEAKRRDLQNRLGFVATLAREKAERASTSTPECARALQQLESMLEPSRLEREDTFGRKPSSDFGRQWLRENRSEAARRWNLLTTWRAEDLRYA
jgi:transcriptional regulator with XRE-family HTH domain